MKLLLYCTKNKWRLFFDKVKQVFTLGKVKSNNDLNGKIVAECDYEVEDITYAPNPSEFDKCFFSPREWCYDYQEKYGDLSNEELLKHSCLTNKELSDYLNTPTNDKKTFCKDTFGYAIHIKNLHIFDKPQRLTRLTKINWEKNISECIAQKGKCNFGYSERYGNWIGCIKAQIDKAPQNMMRVIDWNGETKILISIQPQWMCKILNGEKTIEVRKKVLKEMLNNE